MSAQVFFYEAFEEEQKALRHFNQNGVAAGYTWKTIQEQGDAEPPAAIISLRTQSTLPSAWAGKLKGILTRSTGFDHLAAYRKATGAAIHYGYLPLYCNRSVAEHAMMLWMALLRKLPKQVRQFSQFERDGITGGECAGRSLLVVGVGNIGSEVVKIGHGLAMRVRGVDIVEKFDFVEYSSFSVEADKADIVVCAMNLTDCNRDYFNKETFAAMKRGAIFINISRGELSPPLDLQNALEKGILGGVGLDVYNNESRLAVMLRSGHISDDEEFQAVLKLARRDDVILTPHNAFNTAESVERKAEQSIRQIEALMNSGSFIWNIPGAEK